MKTKCGILVFLLAAMWAQAQTNRLTALLQQGLFEEQANRNLDAAIEDYAALAKQFDKDRQLAATAVFRLGECYRAQGKTNEAALQYQRILRDFGNEKTLATLSQQNLAGMGTQTESSAWTARQQQKELLAKQIALAEQDLAETQKLVQVGKAVSADVRAAEREGLRLRQQLAALDAGKSELVDLSPPSNSVEDKEIARIQQLIQNSPDLINGNAMQGSPLGRAAEAGQLRVAEFLLDSGADVNAPNDTAGQTPLLVAAHAGRKTMVELLLQRGANVNAANNQGQTALHQAVEQGFISVAEVLLAAKADPNRQNEDMQTPLANAARKGSRAMAALLLAHGADPNLARKLRPSYGANPISDGRKMFGTPLHFAAARGDAELVALLLTNRADVKVLSIYSETPLQVAAACGKAEVAELLLTAGADPNARADADASTPLHLAVSGGYRDVVEHLLAQGANPNATAAVSRRDVTPLMLAATGGNDDIALLLLQRKAEPNLKDGEGNTALIHAILANQTAVVKTLLAHGANPEVKSGEWPALMMAAGRRYPEMTSALLATGADVNQVAGGQQETALHQAAANGNLEIVQILLATHANVNLRDVNGNTPLHLAVANGKDAVVPLLLDAKADPNLRNNSGTTPLDLAKGGERRSSLASGTIVLGGNGRLMPGGMPGARPLSYQWQNNATPQTSATNSVADLLRQHGAVDELPDFTRIRITRQGISQPYEVFYKKATLTNQFTLLETVMRFYSLSQVYVPGEARQEAWRALPFPDFGRIIIRRPSQKIGGKEQEIKVSLLNRSNVVDCVRDVPVQFGDVIEIPESVHALNAEMPNPVREMEAPLAMAQGGTFAERLQAITSGSAAGINSYQTAKHCLQKSVQLVVAGETTNFKVNSWKEGFLSLALQKTEARSVLRSSSDLSRVTVTRKTGSAGQPAIFTVDVSDSASRNDDLWLQDGDVIEVPEKR